MFSTEFYISIFAATISLISLFVSIKSYIQDHKRRKKQATIEFYNTICDELYDISASIDQVLGGTEPTVDNIQNNTQLKADVTKMLSTYERFSVGVNSGVFDLDLTDRMAGSYLIVLLSKFLPYIQEIRKDASRKCSYVEFEHLVIKIEERRSTYHNRGRL